MINMGFETQPMHMHGFHGKIIGSDQRAWPWANLGNVTPWGQGLEKQTLTIGSGETYDWLINMGLQSVAVDVPGRHADALRPGHRPAGDATRRPPTRRSRTRTACRYIGGPDGHRRAVGIPTPGQFFPFHNHDDYKATNNGAYPGGMFTMIETLP